MATDIINAVLAIASVIKRLSDDSSANASVCVSLAARVELVPRMLSKFPETSLPDLDEVLLGTLFKLLKESHDLISNYKNTNTITRVLNATSLKGQFAELERKIEKCLDDLNLCVGISSAAKLESIRVELSSAVSSLAPPSMAQGLVDLVEAVANYLIDYNSIKFETKRGIRKEIGSGSFGRIYLAQLSDTSSDVSSSSSSGGGGGGAGLIVAVKEPAPIGCTSSAGLLSDEEWMARVNAVSAMQHRNLCRVFGGASEYTDHESQPPELCNLHFYVMEYCPEGTLLSAVLSQHISVRDIRSILRIGFGIVAGLQYLHSYPAAPSTTASRGIVHGALDPHHILFDSSFEPKIIDFGFLDKVVDVGESSIVGSAGSRVEWLAPELVKGSPDLRPSSDIYSLGLVLSFLMSAVKPFSQNHSTAFEISYAIKQGEKPRTATASSPLAHDGLLKAMELCLTVNADARPSAGAILRAVFAFCQESSVILSDDAEAQVRLAEDQVESASVGGAGTSGASNDDDDIGGLAGFDEMASQIEQMSSSIRLFVDRRSNSNCQLTVYGNKVILQNFIKPGETKVARREDAEEQQDGVLHVNLFQVDAAQNTVGTVIFHIDNTTSMNKFERMTLTKQVLHRIVPTFLRQGFTVLVNSWAMNPATQGRTVTRVVRVESDSILLPENADQLKSHLEKTAFDQLVPNGNTDLYGSCYQLFDQCRALRSTSPVHTFILTDGNHNVLGKPFHDASKLGEQYFGVYECTKQNPTVWKQKINPVFNASDAAAELSVKFQEVLTECNLHATFVGIGDADTAALSNLATALGDHASFYGVTEVSESDLVFANVSAGVSKGLSLRLANGAEYPFLYCGEDGVTEDGQALVFASVSILEDAALEQLHRNSTLSLVYGDVAVEVEVADVETAVPSAESARFTVAVTPVIQDFVAAIKRIRSTAYEVSAGSFSRVFRSLLNDKRMLQSVKGSFFSRNTRYLRKNPSLDALHIWIRELEELIDNQIASYRMNVEAELLNGLLVDSVGSSSSSSLSDSTKPSDMVISRLQNNMKQAGKSAYKVRRYVQAIEGVRDRTIHITSKLLLNQIELSRIEGGLRYSVKGPPGRYGRTLTLDWVVADTSNKEDRIRVINAAVNTETSVCDSSVLHIDLARYTSKASDDTSALPTTFPCVLLAGKFDSFSIAHAPQTFLATEVFTQSLSGVDQSVAPLYCALEVWELCHSSGHNPGDVLPLPVFRQSPGGVSADKRQQASANMILPLAHTPLLFALYTDRGRVYHSAVNVTGDCLALTPVAFQWGKFFHDACVVLTADKSRRSLQADLSRPRVQLVVWAELLLKSIVSFSYAVQGNVAAWAAGSSYVSNWFPQISPIAGSVGVIPRDNVVGTSCPLGFAVLLACHDQDFSTSALSWNLLCLTVFSRYCESISGTKIVRSNNGSQDLGLLEDSYRLLLGNLQSVLRRRLHVEWIKMTHEDKVGVLQDCSEAVVEILQSIVKDYFSQFLTYGLMDWDMMLGVIARSLYLQHYSVQRLKEMFERVDDLTEVVDTLIDFNVPSDVSIPVIAADSTGTLQLRQLRPSDFDFIVTYIDAIVATKAAPKVVYKPVANPKFPTFSAATNRSLNFKVQVGEWNLSLPVANVSFIGNVNSGKSSISGTLLSGLGLVDKHRVDRLGEEAKKLGYSEDLKHAWVMDRSNEERSCGFTIHSTWSGFQSPTRRFTIIDNPGHKDFATNSTFGIFHADIAILVTSAVMSEIKLAELSEGQADDHLLTAFSFGIRKVVVAVNKMDLVDYSQASFEEVKEHTEKKLKRAGFKSDGALFVPVSVLGEPGGLGFMSCSSRMPWYTGPCLLEAIDSVPIPPREADKPFRMVVSQVRKARASNAAILCGKVERGRVAVADEISVFPNGPQKCRVVSLQAMGSVDMDEANPGDDIGVCITLSRQAHACTLKRGMVLALTASAPPTVMQTFEAQIYIVRGTPYRVGHRPTLSTHLDTFSARITKIKEIVNKSNVVVETNPTSVAATQVGIFEMEADRVFAAETVHEVPRLSRFVIKSNRVVVAVGIIRLKIN